MAFFRSIIEQREFSLAKWDAWLDSAYAASQSGVEVTEQSALSWAAVWGCVLVKAQDEAKSPLNTYRRLGVSGKDGREEARDFPTWRIFREAANPYTTAYQFRQVMQKDVEVNGNAYAIIERDAFGVSALWHRRPSLMCPEVKEGRLVYKFDPGNGTEPKYYEASEIFHVRGMSHDGIVGISPIQVFREGIGLALQQQKHGVKSMKGGLRTPYAIKVVGDVGPEKAKVLAKAFSDAYGGPENADKIPFLYGGMEPVALGFNNADAQFIESRYFGVEEACRIWRVPPPKVMDFLRATFSNITEINISYVNDTMRPIQENWEQEIHLKLMTEEERETYYVEHDNYDLLKGTPMERAQIERMYVDGGISQVNEIRGSHNWNPVPGGDKNRTQMQNVPLEVADQLALQPKQQPTDTKGAGK